MKKSLIIAAVFVAFCLLAGGAEISQAQKMVGNYREASKTDETVVEAANFAVETQSKKFTDVSIKLISIEHAERQIVAGSNYRLCLSVKLNEEAQQATATVYLNLQNKFSLSNWTIGKCADNKTEQTQKSSETDLMAETESVSYQGSLEMGKIESLILYLGEESGDYATFCFTNKSEVGRAVLDACKAGEQCKFTGRVDFSSGCQVKNLKANLSASGKIISIESVKTLSHKNTAAVKTIALARPALAPDIIVKNLYAAQKAGSGPFFQTKSRVVVDKYFTKDFADLIWKDAITSNDGVGVLGADPLYNAQDSKITVFLIGKPEYDSNSVVATVLVSFKNFGKAETVKFLFERDAAKTWKIMDIVYGNGDMLKGMFYSAQSQQS